MPVYDLTSGNGLLLDRGFRARSKKSSYVLGRNRWFVNAEFVNAEYPYFYRSKRTSVSTLTNLSMLSFFVNAESFSFQPLGGAFRFFDSLFRDFLLPKRENYTLKKTTH